jgi:hypothetical protein
MKNSSKLLVLSLIFSGLLAVIESEAAVFFAKDSISGSVSFITSENVYLKFENTKQLVPLDTIYSGSVENLVPCLILIQKSSVSVIAKNIGTCNLKVGDRVWYFFEEAPVASKESPITDVKIVPTVLPVVSKPASKEKNELNGMISLNNYSVIDQQDFNRRSIARLSLTADKINGSKFSFRTYSRYLQNTAQNESVKSNTNKFFLYEFAVDYDFDSTLSLTVGRFINPKMMSVGAIDGLKLQKSWRSVFVGAIVGSRPDPYSYALNTNLIQYGAYAGVYHTKSHSSFTNLGVINQTNSGLTDRRYLYLQHQSSLGSKVNLFGSSELDLYSKDSMGNSQNETRLTNLFFSINYRPIRTLTLMASYDVRKNLILYESFAEELDRLLRDDPYRTGLRFRANYRLTKTVFAGFAISRRLQTDSKNEFSNQSLFLNFSKIPWIGGRINTSISTNKNSFLLYNSASIRYSREFLENKLSLTPFFRILNYEYIDKEIDQIYQTYMGVDFNYDFSRKLSLRALYDYSIRSNSGFHRFNVNITQRF